MIHATNPLLLRMCMFSMLHLCHLQPYLCRPLLADFPLSALVSTASSDGPHSSFILPRACSLKTELKIVMQARLQRGRCRRR